MVLKDETELDLLLLESSTEIEDLVA